jgi:hypothetical protein
MNWAPVPVNPNDPVPDTAPTIRSKFLTGSGVSDWFDIATNIEAVLPSDALNVDRDTYQAVQREMADWARRCGGVGVVLAQRQRAEPGTAHADGARRGRRAT